MATFNYLPDELGHNPASLDPGGPTSLAGTTEHDTEQSSVVDADSPKDKLLAIPERTEKITDGNVLLPASSATDSPRSTSGSPPPILYKVNYVSETSFETVYSKTVEKAALGLDRASRANTSVLEYVDTRYTWLESSAEEFKTMPKEGESVSKRDEASIDQLPPFSFQGTAYIIIHSAAVLEALRCVVDYYPAHTFGGNQLKFYYPYPLLTFYETALTGYQTLFSDEHSQGTSEVCVNQNAYKDIGVLQAFIQDSVGTGVAEERERHSRGVATYDWLWLLFQPGTDVFWDKETLGEWEPYVVKEVGWTISQGSMRQYTVTLWNMNASSRFIGPKLTDTTIEPFAGEKDIASLELCPSKFFKQDKRGRDAEQLRRFFVERGKTFFNLQRKGCWDFDGFSTTFPRRLFIDRAMVDPIECASESEQEAVELDEKFETTSDGPRRNLCKRCESGFQGWNQRFKFPGYTKINPVTADGLSEHQYFLCDRGTTAFLFKLREWRELDVSGFKEARFDSKMLDTLVMNPDTKKMIQSLAGKYIEDLKTDQAREMGLQEYGKANETEHSDLAAWSADWIQGKGQGLIFLLHGKPGVGKTYTAECVAVQSKRPLLTLTCADLGTSPSEIEHMLLKWFKLAKSWNCFMLIDEADIYMEQRKVQDLERNNLVAGFLRALEYYTGILFLTTNRVGTFDEAFISRITITIYYPALTEPDRVKVWESFFKKLERERDEQIRIHSNTRDFVNESDELKGLEWNGREIRNAFQIAIALAETEGERDRQGRVIIRRDHIHSTVEMSKTFKSYLNKLWTKDETARAAMCGHRFDAYGADVSKEGSFR